MSDRVILKKELGQHFLRDRGILKRIVDALEIGEGDRVIEIGPGGGALTREILARSPEKLIAIEIDPRWVDYIKENFDSVEVILADAVNFDFSSFPGKYLFVGNLPYGASMGILRNILRHRKTVKRAVFTLQREVARRITADRGKEYGSLSALLKPFFRIERLFDIPPSAFFPVPKVVSTVVRFTPTGYDMDDETFSEFERFLKMAFSHRRKKLKKNLPFAILRKTHPSLLEKRAEEVSVPEFLSMFSTVRGSRDEEGGR